MLWSQLNQELLGHAIHPDWGPFRDAKLEMADILRIEGNHAHALGLYLEACCFDLNGPNNSGGITERELLRQFPPWNPRDPTANLVLEVLNRAVQTIDNAEINRSIVESIYNKHASRLRLKFHFGLLRIRYRLWYRLFTNSMAQTERCWYVEPH